jgi:hypothetical protein
MEASMLRIITVILVLSCATQLVAQTNDDASSRFLFFGGVSENANNLPARDTLLITDQKASPFFSLGSGRGFEFSVTRRKSRHLAYTADLSGYRESFTGGAIYCDPNACGIGLHYEDKAQAFYLVAGPELRGSEWRRLTPFAHGLAGAVFTRSKFTMTGTNVQYVNSYSGTGLALLSTSGIPKTSTVHYGDSSSDTGLTLSLGAGLDVRMTEALSARFLVDYDPTFLTRPDIRDESVAVPTGTTHSQTHVRLSFGIVWRFR